MPIRRHGARALAALFPAVIPLFIAFFAGATPCAAQLQQGALKGVLLAPDGSGVPGATVTLLDGLGVPIASAPAPDGMFVLENIPPGAYTLRATAPGLAATVHHVSVTSALPVQLRVRLSAVAAERVQVRGEQGGQSTTRVTLGGDAVRRAPARLRSRGLQDAIATAQGWATEDNGLLHIRGVDDGVLYVIDGVPVYERLDGLFGMAPDPAMVDTLTIVTGNIPAEYGWKAGGVLDVRSAAGAAEAWSASVDAGLGSHDTRELSALAGGPLAAAGAVTIGLSRATSSRFLDPVHPDNLHNDGASWSGGGQAGWTFSPSNTLTAVGSFSRADFDVPHGGEQEEAGQNQEQRTRQYGQSLSWQRAWSDRTVSQIAQYARSGSSALAGSAQDTPLFVDADRTLRRAGVLASVSHARGRHLIKAGGEASWLRLRERFLFAVTDVEEGREADLSEAALAFTPESPFTFRAADAPWLAALYVQDSFRATDRLTVDAGVRVDWSRLLLRRSQVSPRLGAAYFLPRTGTTIRGSINRFFQPPQAENILLSSSEAAWAISPFADDTGGGAALEPERTTALEAGIDQPLAGGLRLDVAWWGRRIRHVTDPNVFFGSTLLFPNAVARGRASGVEVRLEVPRRRGWSGYLSYGHGRVVQVGPITGGLFLEEEVIEIGPGTEFTPDHDQRNVGAVGVTFDDDVRGFWVSMTGRHESGTPLEVEAAELDELRDRPGADLVDFERGRVKPRTLLDAAASFRLLRRGATDISLRAALLNLTGSRFAWNFGNPFSGTHFGPGRTAQIALRVSVR